MEFKEIKRVLIKILVFNWLVAFAKIFLGVSTGSLSILTDGVHSFFDGLTNIIGFFGVKLAERPVDKDHPYGHQKYEAIASFAILLFLLIIISEILKSIFQKFLHPPVIDVDWLVFGVLAICIIIDYAVARYEYKKGKNLKSTILKADALHTRSHYITTGAVILGTLLIKLGLPVIIDLIIAIFVMVFVFKLGYEIFKETAGVLTDKALVDEDRIKNVVEEMQGAGSCHQIRTRGDERHIFMDLHVVLGKNITLAEAHAICERLEKRIKAEIPEVQDITVHPEPS